MLWGWLQRNVGPWGIRIPNWLIIPLLVVFIPLSLYNGEILWAMASLLLLAYCIWESLSGEKKTSNVEEIKCTNCQQRLNIPENHTGLAGCPACKKKIHLEDGVITN
jgi:DNA-directed RNA polymerase subunit RPC12/RpoP|tara:strand:- start:247 stop:567 length:321 start_codon:yes stop_codon:yes gene_type:complete